MATNAKIIANTGVLVLQNSKLFSSDRMWQGIETNGPIIHVINTRIEDAVAAILLKNNAKLRLDRAVFNLNWIGIANDPGSQNSINFTAQSNIRFLQTGSLKPLPNGDEFEDYTIGIKMDNCSMVLGAGFDIRPVFYGVGTGVQATKSVLRVKYGIFIENYAGGIQGISCPSIQVLSDHGVYHGNVFCNCGFGIGINQCPLEVKSAYFYQNLRDIDEVLNLASQSVEITESTFVDHALVSVSLLRNWQKFNVEISSDTFDVNRPDCIRIWDQTLDNTDNRVEIKNCIIDYTRASSSTRDLIGIIHPGESDLNINNNIITSQINTCCSGVKTNGIAIYNSNDLEYEGTLTFNLISFGGALSETPIHAGIYALACKNLAYCANTFENTNYGLHNEGDCDFSFISTNFFNRHDIGLLVDGPGAVVGVQDRTSNYWNEPSFYTANDKGAVLSGDPDASKFLSHDSSANYMPPRMPEEWFVFAGGVGNNCLAKPEPGITPGELLTVGGQWNDLSESHYWDRKRALLKKLLADPDLIESDSSVSDFYPVAQQQSPGQYVAYENTIRNTMASYGECLNATKALEDTIRLWINAWSDILSAAPDSLSEIQSQAIDSLSSLISAKNLIWQQLISECLDSVRQHVPDLLDSLSVLPENEIYEGHFKMVYKGLLTLLSGDTIESGLATDLQTLASSCYAEYGEMVLLAISFIDPDLRAEYLKATVADSCQVEERGVLSRPNPPVKLYPVPATGYFFVQFDEVEYQNLFYTIYDLSGTPRLKGSISAGQQIDTESLIPGVYFIQLSLPNQPITLPLIKIQN